MPINLLPFLTGSAATGTSTAPTTSATAGLFQTTSISDNFAPDPNIAMAISRNQSQIQTYTYPDDFPKYYIQLGISVYDRTSPFAVASLNPIIFINLPLPMGLIDNHVIEFATENHPILGNLINDTQARPSLSDISKNISNAAGGLINSLKNPSKSILNATRYNLNEFTTIMLRGPSYKKYQFHWRFSPRTPDEAYLLNTIIAVINNNISPGTANPGNLGVNFFTFPNVFQLAIFPNSQYMLKFKPAIVENFVVNYAPAGQPAFMRQSNQTPYNTNADLTLDPNNNTATATTGVGNSPAGGGNSVEGVEISMQFLELEFWLAGDFKQTNNPYDGVASARGMAGSAAPGFGPFAAGGGGVT